MRECSLVIPQSSRNPQSCELRGPARPGSRQQFPFLNSSPIHFIPTWGWPLGGPQLRLPQHLQLPMSWEPRLAVFLILFGNHTHPSILVNVTTWVNSPFSLPVLQTCSLLPGIPRAIGTCLVAHNTCLLKNLTFHQDSVISSWHMGLVLFTQICKAWHREALEE